MRKAEIGSKQLTSPENKGPEKLGEDKSKLLKPDFHQAISMDIQFLRAKFRNYQKDLVSRSDPV